jgi:hypothetical protein
MKMKIFLFHPLSSKNWDRGAVSDSKEWEGA